MTIKEIDDQIRELTNRRYELKKQEIEHDKQEARKNVGRCFKVDGIYAKIVGIPRETYTMRGGVNFNRYQYPAVYLCKCQKDNIIPFHEDTLFSGAWGDGHDVRHTYEEISRDEFQAEFDRRLQQFRDAVLTAGAT